ncbi:MAG TPA: hypothetical protein VEI82_03220, partial [Myxococcota bacterium]|nr:hypothetical protein [Myxococcota bacterium]
MDFEDLYLRLPAALQDLAVSFEGWRLERSRFDAEYRELFAQARERSGWSEERTAEFRDQRLAAFVRAAARHVPHYREAFAREGIDAGAIRGLA